MHSAEAARRQGTSGRPQRQRTLQECTCPHSSKKSSPPGTIDTAQSQARSVKAPARRRKRFLRHDAAPGRQQERLQSQVAVYFSEQGIAEEDRAQLLTNVDSATHRTVAAALRAACEFREGV